MLVSTLSGSVTRVGFYTIRLSHLVLVSTPSHDRLISCWFLHPLTIISFRVGFYTISRSSHFVLVSTPSHDHLISCWFLHHQSHDHLISCWFLHHLTIISFRVGFYTISRSSHFVLVSTPSHDHLISCWFLHHLTIVSSVSLTLYHVTLSAILAYKPHDPGLEVRS